MATAVFQSLADNWDQAIANGVSQTVSLALQANATQLTTMLTIFVIFLGVLTAFGRVTWTAFIFAMSRASMVSLLLTAAYFNQFIQDPAMNTIPRWIAQSVAGAGGPKAGPQQFDQLRDQVIARQATILQQSTGLTMIAERFETAIIVWLIEAELALSFILWEFSRGMMGLLVATAPFIIGLFLFETTRSIATNLGGAAMTLLVMQLMLSILLQLEIDADSTFMQTALGEGGVDVQIDNLASIFVFFLFGVVMTILIPTTAAQIGSGMIPSAAPLSSAPMRGAAAAGREAARGGVAVARGATRLVRGER